MAIFVLVMLFLVSWFAIAMTTCVILDEGFTVASSLFIVFDLLLILSVVFQAICMGRGF